MYGQKSIALINDVTGFSRCSVASQLPILSALKINCNFVPTSILSCNTQVEGFYFDDYTDKMHHFRDTWLKLGLEFEGIAAGFLGSVKQINEVLTFIETFKKEGTKIYVDPVMGDNGILYPTFNKEMTSKMKELVKKADVIFPNLTEACELLDIKYPDHLLSDDEYFDILERLNQLGPKQIVITGIVLNEKEILNIVYENHTMIKHIVKKIGGNRSGCGDVFSAIMIGCLMNDLPLIDSVKITTDFIDKVISFNERNHVPWNYGLCFEEYLCELKL